MLACYCCHLDFTHEQRQSFGEINEQKRVIDHLTGLFKLTPLEIVARVLLKYPHLSHAAIKIFGAYDEFVGMLADDDKRCRLEAITEGDAASDPTYQMAREVSQVYSSGLLEFFFEEQSEIGALTKNYGVF